MKRILIFTVMFAMSLALQAQDDAISRFFEKYQNDDGFTQINITSRMFGLFTDMEVENEEDQEVLDAISDLTGLKILVKDHASNGKALYKEAFAKLPKGEFDELMSIRDGDQDMKFLIKEKEGKISELLMIAGGDGDFFIMSILGNIDLKQISKLSKKMNIDGLENLERLNDDKE